MKKTSKIKLSENAEITHALSMYNLLIALATLFCGTILSTNYGLTFFGLLFLGAGLFYNIETIDFVMSKGVIKWQ